MISDIELSSLHLKGDLYKINIDFFNKFEENLLLATKALFENPDEFFKEKYERHVRQSDTHTFVYEYEGASPAYHKNITCNKLLSNYKNFEIPLQIRNKGKEEISKFRKWFKERESILIDNPEQFLELLAVSWGVESTQATLNSLKREYNNSGPEEIKNIDLNTLENDIDDLIKETNIFWNENQRNRIILNRYAKHAYIWRGNGSLSNDSGYSDTEIRDTLETFERSHKKPLMEDLKHYYRLKFNPEIELKDDLLSRLGFVPCLECERN